MCRSLGIGVTGSHVPHKSLDRVLAAFMPDAAWAVDRYPPDCSRVNDSLGVNLTSDTRKAGNARQAAAGKEGR